MERKEIESQEFINIELYGERIDGIRFYDCIFKDCKFEDMTVENCDFLDCTFENSSIVNIHNKNTVIKTVSFYETNLIGVNWSEFVSDMGYSRPIYKIKDSFLKYNTFHEMDLKKNDFSKNVFHDCTFESCDLEETKFKDCDMKNTQIHNSNLKHTDFRGAKDYYIDIESNWLTKAKFSFPEVTNLLESLDIDIEY